MSEQQMTSLMTDAATTTDAPASEAAETDQVTATTESTESQDPAGAGSEQEQANDADGKKDDDAPAVPDEYEDFKFEDDKSLPEDVVADLKAAAKDLGLTQEQAQKLAERELKGRESAVEAQQQLVSDTAEQWAESARTDSEFGGEQFDANLATAKAALDTYGNDTFKNLLSVSGVGNHPEFIRFCLNVGKQLSEDGHIGGKAPNEMANDARRLYKASNMNP